MPIHKPHKRPFAPWLQNHRAMTGGKGKKNSVADLLLTPLIDMFVILVVFLIMNFSATGELVNITKDITLPAAKVDRQLERAPIIQVSANTVVVEGFRVGDSKDLLEDPDLRIPALTDKLQEMRKLDETMHPGQPFKGNIIISADRDIDFKLVRKVMFASADAGYTNVNYAVLQAGKDAEAAPAAE
ncbi:MAG: biopolymer transporter ExbD [Myxococcales bacterium]|nr:biopolymer transporter ExbD [Myxococcales bacterium]